MDVKHGLKEKKKKEGQNQSQSYRSLGVRKMEIMEYIDKVSSAKKKREKKRNILTQIIKNQTNNRQKGLLRIILEVNVERRWLKEMNKS